MEQQLTARQLAKKLADHFSLISQAVEPLEVDKLFPALREAIKEGKSAVVKPTVDRHQF